mmetsp:Transcript_95047/g.268598  ORF Transcript_95047/g.268598 Transcript_95047/m.268598 type:complete len:254 (+) Transcript_95047:60-821(+)
MSSEPGTLRRAGSPRRALRSIWLPALVLGSLPGTARGTSASGDVRSITVNDRGVTGWWNLKKAINAQQEPFAELEQNSHAQILPPSHDELNNVKNQAWSWSNKNAQDIKAINPRIEAVKTDLINVEAKLRRELKKSASKSASGDLAIKKRLKGVEAEMATKDKDLRDLIERVQRDQQATDAKGEKFSATTMEDQKTNKMHKMALGGAVLLVFCLVIASMAMGGGSAPQKREQEPGAEGNPEGPYDQNPEAEYG